MLRGISLSLFIIRDVGRRIVLMKHVRQFVLTIMINQSLHRNILVGSSTSGSVDVYAQAVCRSLGVRFGRIFLNRPDDYCSPFSSSVCLNFSPSVFPNFRPVTAPSES